MKAKKVHILTSVIFIFSISILILNDFYLKAQFHNWFTGKLSDFAGLFAFGIVITTFVNKKNESLALIATGFFFCWWKSPLSQATINFWNSIELMEVHRIVDYTDLIALLVLPIIPFIFRNKNKLKFLNISPLLIIPVVAFSFISTTNTMRVFTEYKFKDEELKMKFNYPKENLNQMLLNLNGKNLNDYVTDSLVIIQVDKDTAKLSAFNFMGFKNYEGYLANNEIFRGEFVIKSINSKKCELIFYNTYTSYNSRKKHSKKMIFNFVRKGIKKELKKTNQQSDQ